MAKPKLCLIPATIGDKVYSILPSNGVGDFDFTRATTATRINAQGLIEEVASGENRLNYSLLDGKVVGCPHLLLEPSRTNTITHSNDFSQSIYGKINLTITANQGISPDGTQNANLLVPNAAVGNRYLTNSTGSNLKINTVFLKKKELRYVKVGNSQSNVLVDLENGTISAGSVSTNNFTIENYGNGWYRVSCYNTLDVNLQIQIFIGIDGSGSNIATNGTDGVYIYGFEIQNGSYATSYIPTTSGSAVTRLADVCNNGGNDQVINSTEGVLYFEAARLNSEDNSSIIFSISDGSNSNAVSMYYYSGGIGVDIFNSLGTKTILHSISLNQQAQFNKLAIKYKSNDMALWFNGNEVGTNTDAINLTGLNELKASYGNGQFPFYGNVKDVRVYNTALTDQELQALTT